MKKLTIYQENTQPVEVWDNESDDPKLDQKISSLFQVSVVSILETSSAKVYIRPSKLVSITIEDEKEPSRDPEQEKPKEECVQPKEPEPEEDVITDVD